uniref:Uncharacterized protein n=1 Tax=Arundo donax TaxID=35708 RepID=A0A0A9EAZ6_ARUDO
MAATNSASGFPDRLTCCSTARRLCSSMGSKSGSPWWKGPSDTTLGR